MSLYGDESHIQSLARGLAVVRSFRPGRERLTMAEVASACQLTRAGARRILITLQDLGYVASEGRQFFLTSRVLDLSERFLEQSLWQSAKQVLHDVVDTLNETASAGVLEGFETVYTLRIRSSRPLHLEPHPAFPVPAYVSAIGRVLLANLTPSQFRLYCQRTAFERYTERTINGPEALDARLDEVREFGWCEVRGEADEGTVNVAVPVKDDAGSTVAAISIDSTNERASPDHVRETIVPVLQAAAEQIAQSR